MLSDLHNRNWVINMTLLDITKCLLSTSDRKQLHSQYGCRKTNFYSLFENLIRKITTTTAICSLFVLIWCDVVALWYFAGLFDVSTSTSFSFFYFHLAEFYVNERSKNSVQYTRKCTQIHWHVHTMRSDWLPNEYLWIVWRRVKQWPPSDRVSQSGMCVQCVSNSIRSRQIYVHMRALNTTYTEYYLCVGCHSAKEIPAEWTEWSWRTFGSFLLDKKWYEDLRGCCGDEFHLWIRIRFNSHYGLPKSTYINLITSSMLTFSIFTIYLNQQYLITSKLFANSLSKPTFPKFSKSSDPTTSKWMRSIRPPMLIVSCEMVDCAKRSNVMSSKSS